MHRIVALALLALFTSGAAAQPWPSQPVRVIVPASPGSSLDVIARILAEKLRARWNQPVVIEDKAGAGGMLGMNAVARATSDGHTLGIGFNGPIAFAPHLYRHMSYDPAKDLLPIVLTTSHRDEDVQELYAAGANTYIEKPEDFARFVEVLETIERYWLRTALLPFKNPIACATLYFGGMLRHMCTWSFCALPSISPMPR